MNDYADDINEALRELRDRPKSPVYQDGVSHPGMIEFNVSEEIADFIGRRHEESERMRAVSNGVYA